jgi:hypothetical protein
MSRLPSNLRFEIDAMQGSPIHRMSQPERQAPPI